MKHCFHRNAFGLPALPLPSLSPLGLSAHAVAQAKARRVQFDLSTFDPRLCRVFQVVTENGTLTQLSYRRRYDARQDICVVVDVSKAKVVTVWLNHSADPHLTLDRSVYSRP